LIKDILRGGSGNVCDKSLTGGEGGEGQLSEYAEELLELPRKLGGMGSEEKPRTA